MPVQIGPIKTKEAIEAVNRIKNKTKKEIHDVNINVPALFIEKRNYMQSDEFLNDSHNKKMFDLIDKLMDFRDNIGKEIQEKNKTAKDKIVQAINGFSRIKKYLDQNPEMNFSNSQMFCTPVESNYRIIKYQIGNESKAERYKLGK